MRRRVVLIATTILAGCTRSPTYDVVIRGGTIVDGSGGTPYVGDVAIRGDSIAAVGRIGRRRVSTEIDARGMAGAPRFLNMLGWSTGTLLPDGHPPSGVRRGVTLEVMGEGWSMGPLNDEMKKRVVREQTDIKYDVTWTTLGEYLDQLVQRGISCNVASFVGATTVRIHELGYEDRAPNAAEL